METVRFKGTANNDGWPVVILVHRIVHVAKIDEKNCKIHLDTGEYLYVEEQLNVVEARINLAKGE